MYASPKKLLLVDRGILVCFLTVFACVRVDALCLCALCVSFRIDE